MNVIEAMVTLILELCLLVSVWVENFVSISELISTNRSRAE